MSDPTPGVRVSGGCGGTVAVLEDLDRIAATFTAAATLLDEAHGAALRLTAALDATWRDSPVSALAADDALIRFRRGAASAEEARSLGRAVGSARAQYASAELDAGALVRAALVRGGALVGEGGPFVWASTAAAVVLGLLTVAPSVVLARALRWTPGPVGVGMRSLGRQSGSQGPAGVVGAAMSGPGVLPAWHLDADLAQAVVPGISAFALGALPGRSAPAGDPVPDAAGTLAALERSATGLAGAPGVVVVSRLPGVVAGPPPRTPAEVLEVVEAQYPSAGGAPGSVAVQELRRADGSRAWVVAVPGTQQLAPGGSNPADMRTNLRLVAGAPDDMSRVVEQAMRAAGIRRDEPVLLAGHSQGGLVAAAIAADPDLRERYAVRAVLTAGSPVGGIDLPASVEALHLEHGQDLVPALDGRPNPDTRHRTTVVRDLAASGDPRDLAAATPAGAHPLAAYERTARLVQGWDDPSVQGFSTAAAEVLGGAVVARTTVFQGVRAGP